MTQVFVENGTVVVEDGGKKTTFETFVAAAESLGDGSYEAAEAIAAAVEAHGEYTTNQKEHEMQYVLIEMNDYAYPKSVAVFPSMEDAKTAARSLMKERGQTETIHEGPGWEATDEMIQFCTQGEETPNAYIILRTK